VKRSKAINSENLQSLANKLETERRAKFLGSVVLGLDTYEKHTRNKALRLLLERSQKCERSNMVLKDIGFRNEEIKETSKILLYDGPDLKLPLGRKLRMICESALSGGLGALSFNHAAESVNALYSSGRSINNFISLSILTLIVARPFIFRVVSWLMNPAEKQDKAFGFISEKAECLADISSRIQKKTN
jgi:hypothetical protein